MILPDKYVNSDESVKEDIIHIGTSIYFNGLKWFFENKANEEKKLFEHEKLVFKNHLEDAQQLIQLENKNQIEKLQKHYEHQLHQEFTRYIGLEERISQLAEQNFKQVQILQEQHKAHIDEMTHSFDSQIEQRMHLTNQQNNSQIQQININHQSELHQTRTNVQYSYDSLISSMETQLFDAKERIKVLEESNTQAMSLSGKLDSLLGKKSSLDNATKGDFGENIVYNQLMHYFPQSVIDDVSGTTAKGDLLWKMNDESFKCLVEVKNVQHVRPGDIQKFERDIQINGENGSCNCGLFVSLKTETIPSKGKFHFEFIRNMPILYVSNVYEDLETLRLAFQIILNIQNCVLVKQHDNMSQDEQHAIIELVHSLQSKLQRSLKNISSMKSACEAIQHSLASEEKACNDLCSSLSSTEHRVPWMYVSSVEDTKETKKERLIRLMKEFYETNGRMPTVHEVPNTKSSQFRGECSMHKLRELLLAK